MTLEEKATNYCNEMMCTVCSNIRCEYKGKCTEWETRKRAYLAGAEELEQEAEEYDLVIRFKSNKPKYEIRDYIIKHTLNEFDNLQMWDFKRSGEFAEPREKRIVELEETIANLKEQVQSQVEATIELDKENVNLKIDMESSRKAWEKLSNEYKKRWKDCEKENAELKRNKKTVVHLAECLEEIQDKQLAQAKKIIKGLLSCCRNYPQENAKKIEQAEQFLEKVK